ncbi:hypothetical protein L2U69_14855 [Zavarzinia compransoris]|uniref:hypothetical protein n=1 Tax=Zavarzinia marina TaxID=2911065 RepID=UPI001F478B45|nr:hypothetical protein [Zavarzinia marina]MCF4166930.1 hypothetical protein [Zavarzinia marina]
MHRQESAARAMAEPRLREPRLQELRFAGQLALWSLRQGLGLLNGDGATRDLVAEAFSVAAVDRALPALETFLRILAAGAHRPVELRTPQTPGLGHDEALMLRALAACQAGQDALARGLLEMLVAPAAARAGAAALNHVADVFSLQGLRLADTACGRLSALEPLFARAPVGNAGLAHLH